MNYNKVVICGINTSKLKVLTAEEKNALLARSRKGDSEARSQMIEGNLRLVLSIIQRFAGRGENLDDLFQVGCVGLIKAVENFNTELDVQFSTYAVPMIIEWRNYYICEERSIIFCRLRFLTTLLIYHYIFCFLFCQAAFDKQIYFFIPLIF